eukprot:8665065-Pyramimonas_sp.AAC.2
MAELTAAGFRISQEHLLESMWREIGPDEVVSTSEDASSSRGKEVRFHGPARSPPWGYDILTMQYSAVQYNRI